jgi:hypothetical protein
MLLRRQVPSGIELPIMMSSIERAHANTEAVKFTWNTAGLCVNAGVGLHDSTKLLPVKNTGK